MFIKTKIMIQTSFKIHKNYLIRFKNNISKLDIENYIESNTDSDFIMITLSTNNKDIIKIEKIIEDIKNKSDKKEYKIKNLFKWIFRK